MLDFIKLSSVLGTSVLYSLASNARDSPSFVWHIYQGATALREIKSRIDGSIVSQLLSRFFSTNHEIQKTDRTCHRSRETYRNTKCGRAKLSIAIDGMYMINDRSFAHRNNSTLIYIHLIIYSHLGVSSSLILILASGKSRTYAAFSDCSISLCLIIRR